MKIKIFSLIFVIGGILGSQPVTGICDPMGYPGRDSLKITIQSDQIITKQIDLGAEVSLEVVYIPPGKFKMGSTPEEKAWATGTEGGLHREQIGNPMKGNIRA